MIALLASPNQLLHLSVVDLLIIAAYFAMVLGIGLYLKRFTKTGEDFFMAGRDMSSWIAGLSFVAANLGSLELMGWAASAYQYGILATHWYWIGAIPAMLFLGMVMMPFYYISQNPLGAGLFETAIRRTHPRAVRHLVRLYDRADERHQHVFDGAGDEDHPGLGYQLQYLGVVAHGGRLRFSGRAAIGDLQ